MRKILSTAALTVALGLAGPTPTAWAGSASGQNQVEGPVLVAGCVITNDCEVPEPDPDPEFDPRFPASTVITDTLPEDPCETLGICPPDDDDDDPGVDPGSPADGIDGLKVADPCPTHGDCGGGGDDDDDNDDGGTDDSGTDDSGTDDGGTDDSGTDDGGTDDSGTDDGGENDDDNPEPGNSGTGIDTPRPGNPNFTG